MIVAHLDLDAFFAAVEELENPALRRVPLVVGCDPKGRGVVATANYVARGFGIHSAMSCAEAYRRCPQAVFGRPRHALYKEYSREVWSTIREIVPTVEQAGIDEGYLDLGEVAGAFDDARALAEAVRAVVRARRRNVEGGGEGRVRPPQTRRPDRRPTGQGSRVPRAVSDPHPPRDRATRRGAARRARDRDHRRYRGARRRRAAPGTRRQGRPRAPRSRAGN